MLFGEARGQALANLCFKQEARITPKAKDRYGRTVADMECRRLDVEQYMVAAWVYDRYAKGYGHLYTL